MPNDFWRSDVLATRVTYLRGSAGLAFLLKRERVMREGERVMRGRESDERGIESAERGRVREREGGRPHSLRCMSPSCIPCARVPTWNPSSKMGSIPNKERRAASWHILMSPAKSGKRPQDSIGDSVGAILDADPHSFLCPHWLYACAGSSQIIGPGNSGTANHPPPPGAASPSSRPLHPSTPNLPHSCSFLSLQGGGVRVTRRGNNCFPPRPW